MKILEVVAFKIAACGPTSVLIPIITRLKKKGHEVSIFSPYDYNSDRERLIQELGANYYYKKSKMYISQRKLLESIPDLKSYDIVHIHGVFNLQHTMIAKLLKKMNIPYIVSMHGNLMEAALKTSRFKKKVALKLLIESMLNQAQTLHVLAEEEKKDIANIVNNKKIQIIHNGVELQQQIDNNKNTTEGILNVLFLGRIDIEHKGLDILLDAIINKLDKWENEILIHLVGPFDTSKDEDYIRTRIESSESLKNIVLIHGPKYGDEKLEFYNKCNLFIHTSRYEGMPMAVLEAMQAGMPVLVTPGTNMVSVIEEARAGFTVEANIDSISNKLDEIIMFPKEDLRIMGRNAHEWSSKYLNWDIIATQYESMYYETSKQNSKKGELS